MFAQFKKHLHTQWRLWRSTPPFEPASMAIGVSHEATQIHALQLRRGHDGALTIQLHAHVSHLPLAATPWGLTEASLSALAPLLPTPTPALVLALPSALVQHQYRHLPAPDQTLDEQAYAALAQEVAPDSVAMDYQCLDVATPDSSPLYLLCYAHLDAVHHYQRVAQALQLHLSCLDVEPFAALNAWYFWLQRQAPTQMDQVLLLIHARPTDLSVLFSQRQRLIHHANTPLIDTPEHPEPVQARDFILQCWQSFHATHNAPVAQAYLTGRHSLNSDFRHAIAKSLSVPLICAHPVTALAASPPFTAQALNEHAPDLLITFGLALRALDGAPP